MRLKRTRADWRPHFSIAEEKGSDNEKLRDKSCKLSHVACSELIFLTGLTQQIDLVQEMDLGPRGGTWCMKFGGEEEPMRWCEYLGWMERRYWPLGLLWEGGTARAKGGVGT